MKLFLIFFGLLFYTSFGLKYKGNVIIDDSKDDKTMNRRKKIESTVTNLISNPKDLNKKEIDQVVMGSLISKNKHNLRGSNKTKE